MYCLFCQQDTVSYLGYKSDGVNPRACNFYQCKECCFAFTDYTISYFPNKYLYTGDKYYAKIGDETAVNKNQQEKWDHDCYVARLRLAEYLTLFKEIKPLKVLDVGCSNGAMTYVARKDYNFHSFGFEINKDYLNWDKINELSITILGLGKIHDWYNIKETNFDVISFYDVFEHIADPFTNMQYLSKKIKPGGIVIFEQPNPTSELCIEQKLDWKHFRPFQHFYLFSKINFEDMFQMFGFELVHYSETIPGRMCVIGKKLEY